MNLGLHPKSSHYKVSQDIIRIKNNLSMQYNWENILRETIGMRREI